MRPTLLLVAGAAASLSLSSAGCREAKPREGRITGAWVAIAGSGGGRFGPAAAPSAAAPLSVGGGQGDGCVSEETLAAQFGDVCGHEPEGSAPATPGGDLAPGNHPTPVEVRWYCDTRTLIRVVLERCPKPNDGAFRPAQIAVAVRPVKS